MSSKHPLTTETVTFGPGAISPDLTGELSDSTDPTLVHWKRRPYETHGTGYPVQTGHTTGVPNKVALDYPPPSPTHPVEDLDFDTKPSSTYQSLSQLPRAPAGTKYEDIENLGSGSLTEKGSSRRRWACVKCSLYFLTFVALLSCLLACGAIALTSYVYFVEQPPQEDRVSELETQIMEARDTIAELRSMVNELRQNVSDNANLNTEIGELSHQVDSLTESVDEIINPPTVNANTTTPVDLYEQCNIAQRLNTCRIVQETTPVQNSDNEFPGYTSCSTLVQDLNVEGFYNIDMYCAITDPRGEVNPQMATLRIDEAANQVWCYCFVTAFENRRGIVDCSLYVTRCPTTAHLQLS